MKPASLLLGVSVLGNLALCALLFSHSELPVSASAKPGKRPGSRPEDITPPASRSESSASAAVAPFASRDLKTLVHQLRAAGFPEAFVRHVVQDEMMRRFRERRMALTGEPVDAYWLTSSARELDRKAEAQLRALEKTERESVARILGEQSMAELLAEEDGWIAMQYGKLPREKLRAVAKLEEDLQAGRDAVLEAAARPLDAATRQKLVSLEEEKRAELAKILSPQELQEYDLRSSRTARDLRSRLVGFNASELEYRALFALFQPIDAQFPSLTMTEDAQFADRRAVEQRIEPQIQALLGPERYADYQQAMHPEHRQLNQLVARLGLPLSAAAQVVAVQRETQQRAAVTRNDRSLAPAAREAQLRALAEEATAKVTAALGRRGYEGYQLNGGNWLQNIAPRAAAKK